MSVNLDERSLPRRARSVRTSNFLGGFASLFRSLPLSVFPPRKSLWEQSGDDIRENWQEVGDDLREAMGIYQRDRAEALRFAKRFEKLSPEAQKLLLTFARDLKKD